MKREQKKIILISICGRVWSSCISRFFNFALLLLKMKLDRLLLQIVQKDGRVFVRFASQFFNAATGCARLFGVEIGANVSSSGREIVAIIYEAANGAEETSCRWKQAGQVQRTWFYRAARTKSRES